MPELAANFPWWAVLVDVLTIARLTRLATKDTFPPVRDRRQRLLTRTTGPWKPLWVCAWCMSPWIGLVVGGLHLLVGGLFGLTGVFWWTLACGYFLAASHIVGVAADRETS